MKTVFIGIDPGLHGAVAVIDTDTLRTRVFPHGGEISGIASAVREALAWCAVTTEEDLQEVIALLEDVHSMPKQGVSTTFKFGQAFGVSIGALSAFGVPFDFVTPAKWKATILGSGKHEKADSLEKARQLFPQCADMLKFNKQDGNAEALLIAEYGRRIEIK